MCILVCSRALWNSISRIALSITDHYIALCNIASTTRRETDYARDRIWEKDPKNFDECYSENSDPYMIYGFGSDSVSPAWTAADNVRYC
jgi:hypothetical protein